LDRYEPKLNFPSSWFKRYRMKSCGEKIVHSQTWFSRYAFILVIFSKNAFKVIFYCYSEPGFWTIFFYVFSVRERFFLVFT
jgi:hypothetical protein